MILKKPAMIPSSVNEVKNNFLRLVKNLYSLDPGNKHIYSEKFVKGSIGGINFKGTLDRLEKDNIGRYIIVDYKTGTKVTHVKDDPITCLQGLIYAYLLENYGKDFGVPNIKVHHIEFRYPEKEVSIPIIYDQQNKQALLDMVKEFKDAVDNQTLFDKEFKFSDQKYIEKYFHLFSLMKGVKNL